MTMSGAETIARVREHQSKTMLAFSRGKDAICAWLAIREHFDEVVPYYQYTVPGLEFELESLDYYERYFGCKIIRLPSPALYKQLRGFIFQSPENCEVIEQADLPRVRYIDMQDAIAASRDLQSDILSADGVRAADSLMRRTVMLKHGPISWGARMYHPVWDWKADDVADALRKNKVRLPIDYKIWGRTFDGIDARFLIPLRKHFPRDYRRILEFFPLAELEVFRRERAL